MRKPLALLLPLWLLMGSLTMAADPIPAPTTDIDTVQICKTVDERNRAVDQTDVFLPTDPFFCSIHARAIQDGTPLAINWYCHDNLIKTDRFIVHQEGEANLYFQFDPPENNWDCGDYKADVLVNDRVARTIRFHVRSDPAAQVVGACLCRDIDQGTCEPVEPTDTYGPRDPFYCSLKLDSPRTEDVSIKWVHGSTDVLNEVHTSTKVHTTHYLVFWLRPTRTWDAGDYQAQLFVEGQLVKTLSFKVLQ